MQSHQDDPPEFFSGLEKQTLRRIARNWAEEYPVIRKVILFRARASETFKYVLLVQYDENDSDGSNRFRRWSFGHENCGHVIADLADAYKLLPQDGHHKDEWIWLEEPLKSEFCSEFIVPDQFVILYGQSEQGYLIRNPDIEAEMEFDESFQIKGKMDQIWIQIEKLRRMPVHSIREKEIRDREIDDKMQMYNELEFYHVWESVIKGKCEPEPLTEYGQERIADAALSSGFIGLWDLVYLLAADKRYQDLIPPLWKKYQCDVRGPKAPDVSTVGSRVGVWQVLLYRWAHGMSGGIRDGLRPIPYLPLHCFNERIGRYEKRDSKDFIERSNNGPEYVGLKDLGKYLTDVVRVPLPHILFPEASELLNGPQHEKFSYGLVTGVEKEKHEEVETSAKRATSRDEDFIKGLRISVENDQEILIQQPSKPKIPYRYTKVGFQTANKTWRDLLEILKDPEYSYNLGTATSDRAKRRDYDARRKRLDAINRKLVIFFKKEFPVDLPRKYKLYERDKTKRDGTYAFRFRKASCQESNRARKTKFDNFDGDQLLAEIERLALEYKRFCVVCEDADAEAMKRVFIAAVTSGLARGVVTADQIKDVLVGREVSIDISKLSIERLLYAEDSQD
jgi:hypothetical protein